MQIADYAIPEAQVARTAPGARVEVRNLSRRFDDNRVISDLNLTVRPGEFVSIVGKSGCGKSTLLRLISGLDQPSAGQITVDGQPAEQAGDRLRIMFQEPRLLPWASVSDNVAVGLRNGRDKAAVAEALRAVELSDKGSFWPAQLSGGQRQRVALARALVSHPGLLMFDEPLGALDALTRLTMQNLIQQMHQQAGFTAILVTHDVAEAVALSDRVIVLGQGRIIHEAQIVRVAPVSRGSPELAAIEAEILDTIFQG